MPAALIHQPTPADVALLEKRERLAAVRTELAEREAEIARLRVQLKAFEARYLREVATLYAALDDLEAHLLEREAELSGSAATREQAEQARRRAEESHQAVFGTEDDTAEDDRAPSEPAPNLKALYRELAKLIHPDLARDEAEGRYFHLLMARANRAYSRGELDLLQRLLDDHRELNDATAGESAAAESLRITRQIRHAERDLAHLEAEHHALLGSEIAQLFADAESAAIEHRDLLAELAAGLRAELATAERRLETPNHPIPSGPAHAG